MRRRRRHVEITVAANAPDESLRLARLYLIDGLSALVASMVRPDPGAALRRGMPLIVLGLAFAGFDYTTYSPLQNDPPHDNRLVCAAHRGQIGDAAAVPGLRAQILPGECDAACRLGAAAFCRRRAGDGDRRHRRVLFRCRRPLFLFQRKRIFHT